MDTTTFQNLEADFVFYTRQINHRSRGFIIFLFHLQKFLDQPRSSTESIISVLHFIDSVFNTDPPYTGANIKSLEQHFVKGFMKQMRE